MEIKNRFSLDDLYYECVQKAFPRLLQDKGWYTLPHVDWSDSILGFFYTQGRSRGFLVDSNRRVVGKVDPEGFASHRSHHLEDPKEYLVDLCWRKPADSKGRSRVFLSLELEWNPIKPLVYGPLDILDEDIEKLLDVKSDFSVGIMGVALEAAKHLSRGDLETVAQTFSEFVHHEHATTTYLLMFVDNFYPAHDPGVEGWLVDETGKHTALKRFLYEDLSTNVA